MMIEFGKKTTKVFSSGVQPVVQQIEGYYLVYKDNRYFISECVDEDALNKLCNRLMPDNGVYGDYDYWIDYCYGYACDGRLAWLNLDQTDKFF